LTNIANSAILTDSGYFVSENMMRLNEILQDYDPYLSLEWIPTDKRAATDGPPYRIMHYPPNKPAYVVMHITEVESNNPQLILAKLFAGDNWNKNVLKTIEAKEVADKIFRLKEQTEEMEERHDMAHFLLTNRSKNWVTWKDPDTGDKVKLDDQRRRV
jgi:hypothetical protein